jgi:hypothetical protein
MASQLSESIRPLEVLGALSRTTVAGGTTTGIDLFANGRPQEIVFCQSIGAISGAGATLAMKVQDSEDNSTFADVTGAAFTNSTATGFKEIRVSGALRRYVRVNYTITGTTPAIVCAVIAILGEALDAPI